MGSKNTTTTSKPSTSKGKGATSKPSTSKGKGVKILTHANGAEFSPERPGVLAFIVAALLNAHKGGGLTKATLLAQLVKAYPDRGEGKMKATVAMQVPSGLYIEKGYVVSKTPSEGGTLYSLSPKAKEAGDAWRNHADGGMTGTLARPAKPKSDE